jgi:L-lactate dehydrogenase complex protein LldG
MNAGGQREKILGRIREALQVPAPRPGAHGAKASAALKGGAISEHAREWLPRTGQTVEEHVDLFTKTAIDLKAEVVIVESLDQAIQAIAQIRDAGRWSLIATHSGDLANAVTSRLNVKAVTVDRGYDVHEMERCDASITECDALVAQTGSVLITARSAGGRALSVLPLHHIVVARLDQLIPDLPEAFALLKRKYGSDFPSFISFITGPSRTGDIERILVLGAHGPKRLTIVLLANGKV